MSIGKIQWRVPDSECCNANVLRSSNCARKKGGERGKGRVSTWHLSLA